MKSSEPTNAPDPSIRIRLTAEQKKRLEDMAWKARLSVSEYVRVTCGLK